MVVNRVKCIAIFAILIHATIVPLYHKPQQDLQLYNDIIIFGYYTKRLSESAYYLLQLHNQQYHYQPCNVIEQTDFIQVDSLLFFHHKIKSCLSKMIKTQSLQPILILFEEIKYYPYTNDDFFIHELSLLMFTIHKQIIYSKCEKDPYILKEITLDTIIAISSKINELPIAEILNAIDMLVKELPPFLEKYEFNSTISWKEWLKKHWWVPPIIGGWFALRLLLSLQQKQFYYSSYLYPRHQGPLRPIITNDAALEELLRNRTHIAERLS